MIGADHGPWRRSAGRRSNHVRFFASKRAGGRRRGHAGGGRCQRSSRPGSATVRPHAQGARRKRAAVLSLSARRQEAEDVGRRLGEGGDRRRVPGFREARGRAHATRARRPSRVALARQCGGVGLCDHRGLPRHHDRSARQIRGGRLRRGRRLVLPARPRPLDPGHRPRELPIRAGVRQRLFLGVRHLQHHRLDRSHAARRAGEDFRRAGGNLRALSEG